MGTCSSACSAAEQVLQHLPLLCCAGESDAYSYLSAKQRLSLREDDARQMMRQVLSALAHMHDQVRGLNPKPTKH